MHSSGWRKKLAERVASLYYRERRVVEWAAPAHLIDFASNDYLGLHKHPRVIERLVGAAQRYGFGSGASPLVTGYSAAHQEVEQAFAQWLGVERALLFGSGYAANIGVFAALCQRHEVIFSDKLSHASILDGILLSRAKHIRFQHNNMTHVAQLAESNPPDWIVTESIFSMEGDIAPIPALVALAKHYGAGLIIDDAHGIGVLGNTGQGIKEHCALSPEDYTCLMMPLGKAFNAMGAMVAGSQEVIEAILQFSRSYCYSTAIPPLVCVGILAALDVMIEEPWRHQRLQENIEFFMKYATHQGLTMVATDRTPIQSVMVVGNENVLSVQATLLSQGFYTAAIRSPTVPAGTERLRLSIHAHHTEQQLMQLVDHIVESIGPC